MKLIFKGRYKSEDQLPKANLPQNAVRFIEPETPAKVNIACIVYAIPVFLLLGIAVAIKTGIYGEARGSLNFFAILLGLIMILPHELLHGIAFPKDAEVQIWFSIKNMMAFCVSTYPTSKRRFVFLCLLPNVVFGLLPLIFWVVVPFAKTDILFSFSAFSLLAGVGDYLNVHNALIQMPKGSITQLSGFHSYWYYPDNKTPKYDKK